MKHKRCSVCRGRGEVHPSHWAASENMSGEVVADPYHSCCNHCHGTGIEKPV